MIKCFLVKVALRKDTFRWTEGEEGGTAGGVEQEAEGRKRRSDAHKPERQVDALPSLPAACAC